MSFEELIMSKDKYPSIFPCQMEAIVFIIHQIFFSTHMGLKIFSRQFQLGKIQSRDLFKPIASEQKYLMDYNMQYLYILSITIISN